jgi:hypothetical protein
LELDITSALKGVHNFDDNLIVVNKKTMDIGVKGGGLRAATWNLRRYEGWCRVRKRNSIDAVGGVGLREWPFFLYGVGFLGISFRG